MTIETFETARSVDAAAQLKWAAVVRGDDGVAVASTSGHDTEEAAAAAVTDQLAA